MSPAAARDVDDVAAIDPGWPLRTRSSPRRDGRRWQTQFSASAAAVATAPVDSAERADTHIISHHAHRDRRRPCGVRAQAAPGRHARTARTRRRRSRHAQRRAGRLSAICADVGAGRRRGRADRGIVLGGSGQGEQIAANKVRGVRAALCNDLYTARLSRQHNDANVLAHGRPHRRHRPRRRDRRRCGSTRRSKAAGTSAASIRSRRSRTHRRTPWHLAPGRRLAP